MTITDPSPLTDGNQGMNADSANETPHVPFAIEIETTESERVAAIKAAQSWVRSSAHGNFLTALLSVGAGAFLVFYIAGQGKNNAIAVFWAVFALYLFIFASAFVQQRKMISLVASEIPARFSLRLGEEGFTTETIRGASHLLWSSIQAIERRSDVIILFLHGFQVLWLPVRCFADEAMQDDFVREIETRTGLTAKTPSAAPQSVEVPNGTAPSFLRALASNLWAAILFLFLRKSGADHLRGTVPQFVALLLLSTAIGLGFDLARVGLNGELNRFAIPYQLWWVPLVLLWAWCCTRLGPDARTRVMDGAVMLMGIGVLIQCVQESLAFVPDEFWRTLGRVISTGIGWLIFAWYILAICVALVRIYRLRRAQGGAVAFLLIVLVMLPSFYIGGENYRLWEARYDANEDNDARRIAREQVRSEAVLYSQPAVLEKTLADVQAAHRLGVPELYLVAFGGNGSQDVFLREVLSVDTLFKERFDTAGRSVVLINNPATAQERPMASVTALQRTLDTIGSRMNKDEDVLFLFMTSHGSANFHFDLSLWPYRFEELTPARLRGMLDASGIKNRVVVVSACYSGGFIDALADEHTLVMTAARADRNSHGCSHEADWTFFGRAYFDEALRHTYSFTTAFEQARHAIAEREAAEGYEASEPQIAEGEKIGPVLEKIERRLAAAR